ncbi:MAG: hypothetical protein R2766_02725 [Saprospiraceae bacterium]
MVDQDFDLALIKTVNASTPGPYYPGSTVSFDITVFNQGSLDAYDVQINDYIPAELILNDLAWTLSGTTASLANEIDFIGAGENVTRMITFTINNDFQGTTIINNAEIASAASLDDGPNVIDEDSTPNDNSGTPPELSTNNDIDDEAPGTPGTMDNPNDSDDYDPEQITVTQEFDIALKKVISTFDDTNSNGDIDPGEKVTFAITVYNQGTLDATDVVVTDYMPTGTIYFAADNSGWTGTAPILTTTVSSLPKGAESTVYLTLQVDPMFMGHSMVNNAEITAAQNLLNLVDEDSPLSIINGSPDNGSELVSDNDIDDEAAGTPGTKDNPNDYDDWDPVYFPVGQIFDLALTKLYTDFVDKNGDGVLSPGDDVQFTINVYNQGTLDAYKIQITDYIPSGMSLIDPNWNNMQNVNLARLNSVIPFLGAGEQTSVTILLHLDVFNRQTSIVNWAEISAADDDNDNVYDPPVDVDSTPNSVIGDDTFGGDNEINNANNDEDDHDPAEIKPIIIMDLALTKKDQSNDPVSGWGEVRTFDIDVTNQGTIIATQFAVVDYVPCGMEFMSGPGLNPGWTYNPISRKAEYIYDNQILEVGETVTLHIQLKVVNCTTDDPYYAWTNYAEISEYDDDLNHFNAQVLDIDSHADETNFDDAGGEPWGPSDDSVIGDGTGPIGSGPADKDEDDHDPAKVEIFDLALKKELVTINNPYRYGDLLEFKITVCNQGNIGAQNVVIGDYLPAGYNFSFANNTGWTGTVASPEYTISSIEVEECQEVSIYLTIQQTNGGEKDWINYSEILSAENENGEDRTNWDVDSTPGSNNSVENSVEPGDAADNDLTSNDKGGEEDDHDPAGIELLDLAMRKVTGNQTGPYEYGDMVTFTFEVFNQGSIETSNIVLTDYIPCGFKYVSSNDGNGWSYDSNTGYAIKTLPNTLVPGASTTTTIILEIQQCIDNDDDIFTNYAEISDYTSTDPDYPNPEDVDSMTDSDPDNDTGGVPDTSDDDNVDGDKYQGEDEDDHDPERIEVFDLALKKELLTINNPYRYGDELEFKITVCNQGNVDAASIKVSDYLPAGYSFSFANNPGWGGTVTAPIYSVPGVLAQDACTEFNINLTIQQTNGGEKDWINYAEITSSTDTEGNVREDADSVEGSNGAGENAVEPGDAEDNDLTSTDKGGEEDDHDPAGIELFDLAQRKVISNQTGPYEYGDVVTFTMEVYNQGSIEASNIELTDYIPCGFKYAASNDANGWTYNSTTGYATKILVNNLAPGANTSTTINLEIQQCLDNNVNSFTNYVEISDHDSTDPDYPNPEDVDSKTDDDPNNDTGGVPDTSDDDNIEGDSYQGEDEDDHDPERIEVFDLALKKELLTINNPYRYGDDLEFKITVCNQGNVDAANIEVSDYLPAGYSFSFANNPGWGGTVTAPIYKVPGVLAQDACTQFSIHLTIQRTDGGEKDWINYAEITSSTDTNGNVRIDADSVQGSNGAGENAVEPGDAADNDLTSTDKGGEEDDHDPAGIESCMI